MGMFVKNRLKSCGMLGMVSMVVKVRQWKEQSFIGMLKKMFMVKMFVIIVIIMSEFSSVVCWNMSRRLLRILVVLLNIWQLVFVFMNVQRRFMGEEFLQGCIKWFGFGEVNCSGNIFVKLYESMIEIRQQCKSICVMLVIFGVMGLFWCQNYYFREMIVVILRFMRILRQDVMLLLLFVNLKEGVLFVSDFFSVLINGCMIWLCSLMSQLRVVVRGDFVKFGMMLSIQRSVSGNGSMKMSGQMSRKCFGSVLRLSLVFVFGVFGILVGIGLCGGLLVLRKCVFILGVGK